MKKLVLLLSLLLLTGCGSAGGKNTADAPKNNGNAVAADTTEKDVLVVGLDDTFAPMGFRDDKGELVGFDIDLAKEAGKIMGVEMEFQPIDWTVKETELASGNIDLIWNGFSITPQRQEAMTMSDPYLENRQIIIVMADSTVNSKADLAGKTITVQGESSALEAVLKDTEFVDSLASAPVEYATNLECFKDVESKRCDAIVVDEVLARYYMSQNNPDSYKVLDDNFGDEQFAVGMRKEDTALAEKLNAAFKEMKDNGKYDEYYSKWFK